MSSRFQKKIIFGSLVVLFLASLVSLFYWGRRSVEPYIRQMGDKALQTRWEFANMELNPLNGEVLLHGVKVYHPDRKNETIAQMDEMEIKLKSLSSLLEKIQPIEIKLKHPKILFATNRNGEWELAGRIPLIQRGREDKLLAPFDIENILVQDGEVEFRDGRKGVVIPLSQVKFKAEQWQLPTKKNPLPVEFEASFKIANSTEARAKGHGDFLSRQTSLTADLEIKGLSLPPYAPYYDHGLPARVVSGLASFSTKARCENDQLHVPVHAEVSGLQIELRKNKGMGFMAESIVEEMKNSRGNVEIDLMISGDIRKPQFVVLSDLEPSMGQGFKAAGREVKEGTKSGWRKFKGLF